MRNHQKRKSGQERNVNKRKVRKYKISKYNEVKPKSNDRKQKSAIGKNPIT